MIAKQFESQPPAEITPNRKQLAANSKSRRNVTIFRDERSTCLRRKRVDEGGDTGVADSRVAGREGELGKSSLELFAGVLIVPRQALAEVAGDVLSKATVEGSDINLSSDSSS